MSYAERAAIIDELERHNRESVARALMLQRRYELEMAVINLAMSIYTDIVTAPMRALAEELRR